MKIDVFCHIIPPRYWKAVHKKAPAGFPLQNLVEACPTLVDLDLRFRILDKYPDVMQVVTNVGPPPEAIAGPDDAAELCRMANDEMAELVAKHPDRFAAAVATLPMNNMDAALKEVDRAIIELGLRGVQVMSNINGKPLDAPEFLPLYEKMAHYDLPIWIHPLREPAFSDYTTEKVSKYSIYSTFGWPYETTVAMTRLVFSGVLEKYPDLKIITHHCGGMVPYFEQRIQGVYDYNEVRLKAKYVRRLRRTPADYFRRFYADTAIYGSTPGLMCGHAFFGTDHILFATDFPFDSQVGERHLRFTIRSIEQMDIPAADKEKIFEHNARKLLRLPV